MSIAATIVFACLIAWSLYRPHTITHAKSLKRRQDSLFDQKERCVQVLKDLELDHATGKISSDDYERTKRTLAGELAPILEEISKHNEQP